MVVGETKVVLTTLLVLCQPKRVVTFVTTFDYLVCSV